MKASSAEIELQTRLYRSLARIRRAEEEIARIYPSDKIKSPVHLAIGQEYIAVAVCDHLRNEDYAAGTYRGHGVYLAKGAPMNEMMAELYGKKGGCAQGRAGSMHLVSVAHGVIGMSAVVGTGIPIAVGHALALKQQKKDSVVVCFFGDGATEEGCFSESLNFAALHHLPILFICENNQLAIHEPLEKRWATTKLIERVETYDIPSKRFAVADIFAIHSHVGEVIKHIRTGGGPAFIECITHRWYEHVGPNEDYDQGYRSGEEGQCWRDQDVYLQLGKMLPSDVRQNIDQQIELEIAESIAYAETSPFPAVEELYEYVYSD